MKQCGISFILTLLLLSCNDQSQYYYPNEVGTGTGRGTSQRYGSIMDSTIAGVPKVVGSEWVYSDSDSYTTDTLRVGISRLRLDSIIRISYDDSILLLQEFIGTETDTFGANILRNQLQIYGFPEYIWGTGLPYEFPLFVGKLWNYGTDQTGSLVAGKGKITVKAGTFDAYDIRSYDRIFQIWDRWYAPGVGIVSVSLDGLGVYHAELLSYHIGPRRR